MNKTTTLITRLAGYNKGRSSAWRGRWLVKTAAVLFWLCALLPLQAQVTLNLSAPAGAECGDEVTVEVAVDGFTDVGSLQFSVNWDDGALEYSSSTPNLPDEDPITDNLSITPDPVLDQLALSWFDDDPDFLTYGKTLANGTVILEIVFTVLESTGTTTVELSDTPTLRGASDNAFGTVAVNFGTNADITASPATISINSFGMNPFNEVCVGDEARFLASPPAAGMPPVMTYNWDFTDGAPTVNDYGQTASDGTTRRNKGAIWTTPGTYDVDLTVIFDNGCESTAPTHTVTVNPLPELVAELNGVAVTSDNDGTTDTGTFAVCDGQNITVTTAFSDLGGAANVRVFQTVTGTNATINFCNNCQALLTAFTVGTSTPVTLTDPTMPGTVVVTFQAWADANNNGILDANECTGDVVEYTIDIVPGPLATAPANINYQCAIEVPKPEDSSLPFTVFTVGNTETVMVEPSDDSNDGAGCAIDPLIITRTWTYTDNCDNTESVSQIITVADTIAPLITCVGNLSEYTDPDVCTWTSPAGSLTPTVSDNCGTPTVTWTVELPEGTTAPTPTPTPMAIATWDFEDAAKRATNLPYTADGGNAANEDVATVEIVGASFTAFTAGSGGGGSSAASANTWTAAGDNYWQATLSTDGFENLSFSSAQRSSNTGPQNFEVEYSLDGTVWAAVPGSSVAVANNFTTGVLNDIALPSACDDQATLFLRWRNVDNVAVNGGTVAPAGTNRIDDIVVIGQAIATGGGGMTLSGTDDASGTAFPLGTSIVTYKVTDACGNTASCSFNVTVTDKQAPTLFCLTNTVFLNPEGEYTLVDTDVLDFDNSFDNCSDTITVTGISPDFFTCDDLDETFTVLVTAEDASGNSATCNAIITIDQGTALPAPWQETTLGTGTGDAIFQPCDNGGEFTLTSNTRLFPMDTDNYEYVYQELCGEVTITAQITQFAPNGWQGLFIRNAGPSNTAGLAYRVQGNTTTMPSSLAQAYTRQTDGGVSVFSQFNTFVQPYWVRIVSTPQVSGGRLVQLYASPNGTNWTLAQNRIVSGLNDCVEVGLILQSQDLNTTVEAKFANVEATGTPPVPLQGPNATTVEQSMVRTAELFPNPTSSYVTLSFSHPLDTDAPYILRNQMGQAVLRGTVNAGEFSTELNVGQLAAGMYSIEVLTGSSEREVLRFIKQ